MRGMLSGGPLEWYDESRAAPEKRHRPPLGTVEASTSDLYQAIIDLNFEISKGGLA